MTALELGAAFAGTDFEPLTEGAVAAFAFGAYEFTPSGSGDQWVRGEARGFPALLSTESSHTQYRAQDQGWYSDDDRTYAICVMVPEPFGGFDFGDTRASHVVDAGSFDGTDIRRWSINTVEVIGGGTDYGNRHPLWPRVSVLSTAGTQRGAVSGWWADELIDAIPVSRPALSHAEGFELIAIQTSPTPESAVAALMGVWAWDVALDATDTQDTARHIFQLFGGAIGFGAHSARQRQNPAGNSGGWPLRARQNAGASGAWPLRAKG